MSETEQRMKLAEHNMVQCSGECRRVGPANGAMAVVWWAGIPLFALCQDCMGVGRQFAVKRTDGGLAFKLGESFSEPSLILQPSPTEVSQVAAHRAQGAGEWA